MTTLAIGTEKGAWFLRSDDRQDWEVSDPAFAGWRVTAFGRAPDGDVLAATGSNWFGPGLQRSSDLDEWTPVAVPEYPDDGPTMKQVWTLRTDGHRVLAGVDEAGLFSSTDDLASWQPVSSLNDHATRPHWGPGFGGLCAHRIITSGERWWVGISAVGLFRSDDAGGSWQRCDAGIGAADDAEDGAEATGWCIHGLVADPEDPDRMWRQDHRGLFRSTDAGDSWERIQEGLPGESGFGFAIDRDHATGRLFVSTLHSDERRLPVDGRFGVWASDDDGDSWHLAGEGFPPDPTNMSVLRGAISTDQQSPGGVYVGTTAGQVWGSVDNGDSWQRLPGTYPRVLSVEVVG